MPVMLLGNYRINCYLDVASIMYKPPPAEHPSDDELPSAGDVNSLAHLFKYWGRWHSILFLIIMIVAAGVHRAVQCYIKLKFDISRARALADIQLDLEAARATCLPVSRAHSPVRTPSPVPSISQFAPSQRLIGPPGPSTSSEEEMSPVLPPGPPATNLRRGRGAKGAATSQPKGKDRDKEKKG